MQRRLGLPVWRLRERHLSIDVFAFSGALNTLGTRNLTVFEATQPRPTCSRTYASPTASPRPSQGSLSAQAGSPLAEQVSHPLEDERSFMESALFFL